MNQIILLVGVVIMICVLMGRVTSRLAVPSLLIFIGLGMLFGEDGIFRIVFDDYGVTETICQPDLYHLLRRLWDKCEGSKECGCKGAAFVHTGRGADHRICGRVRTSGAASAVAGELSGWLGDRIYGRSVCI